MSRFSHIHVCMKLTRIHDTQKKFLSVKQMKSNEKAPKEVHLENFPTARIHIEYEKLE